MIFVDPATAKNQCKKEESCNTLSYISKIFESIKDILDTKNAYILHYNLGLSKKDLWEKHSINQEDIDLLIKYRISHGWWGPLHDLYLRLDDSHVILALKTEEELWGYMEIDSRTLDLWKNKVHIQEVSSKGHKALTIKIWEQTYIILRKHQDR